MCCQGGGGHSSIEDSVTLSPSAWADEDPLVLLSGGAALNCTPPAIDDFPRDFFTEQQRQEGAVVVHVAVSLYLFVALAVVCDKYFVPAVERICQALSMSNDVAGATFMAAATSAPELFVNVVGTFITEGDIGIGTIVGSAVFNILAVAACCGIGAGMAVPLDWWPLTRDCLAYGVTVGLLISTIRDERVEWYEALTLVLMYIVYIGVMYWDKSFQKCARSGLRRRVDASATAPTAADAENPEDGSAVSNNEMTEVRIPLRAEELTTTATGPPSGDDRNGNLCGGVATPTAEGATTVLSKVLETKQPPVPQQQPQTEGGASEGHSVFRLPRGQGVLRGAAWVAVWPIHLVFFLTIPDCERPALKRWFPLTFLMCIVWIGSLSYVVAWTITIIGDTLKIPDSVMGITFLAAGTSVPEAVSSVIVAKQGHGSMGISNSIGSNTFDILLCLGLPWLIKASLLPSVPGHHSITINSRGLEYSAISLLSTLLLLYLAFACNRFKLDRKVGVACLCMYAVFLLLASLIELNAFFVVNLPTCGR
ncbi:sodium/potassium/calcium exchanger 3 [Ischnura elegans]|uniref:sodium/potassium/calcium exchanger 3 n=1 Tax=Ischnura elegans TaxID=197161 RepID=UPI001ED89153|nr:sodium/potassium/calcium exchanger 3 [Ischnura elegans]